MLTVGVKAIAQHAIQTWYPATFDIRDFEFNSVRLGPINGSEVRMVVNAAQPIGLPVNARVKAPMLVKLWYTMPPLIDDPSQQRPSIYIGRCRMNDENLSLSNRAGDNTSLDVTLMVDNVAGFARMVNHILYYDHKTPSGIYTGDTDRYNMSVPVLLSVDVVLSSVQVVVWDTAMLGIDGLQVQKDVLLKGACDIISIDTKPVMP
jgi:hypothetical protein